QVLSELSQHLPESLFPEILEAACAITDEFSRAQVLCQLSQRDPSLFPDALKTALAITDEFSRAQVLRQLIQYLPKSLFPEVLETARAFTDECYRGQVLSDLIQRDPSLFPDALKTALAITDEYTQDRVLCQLSQRDPSLFPDALKTARAITDESSRAGVLSPLSPTMPKSLFPDALEIARASVFCQLIQQDPSLFPEALENARAILDESYRAPVLFSLATSCPEDCWPALRLEIDGIQNKGERAKVWFAYAQRRQAETWDVAFWQDTLHILAYQKRSELMTKLEELAPVLVHLGGESALGCMLESLRAVCRQWP
ncbi:hypothetical protein NG797_01570, partial [Laspinema sp. D5]|nr:hypothetical protein [Laspinema sp. D3d]